MPEHIEDLTQEELLLLLREYNSYVMSFEERYGDGCWPVCVAEFYQYEFQEIIKLKAKRPYNVGDYVTFKESFEIADEYLEDLPDDWEMAFSTCDVTKAMLEELDRWEDNQIASIDEDGDITFVDIPYIWPVDVIAGLSSDQRIDDD